MSPSRRYVFMGYLFGQKGWKLYDLDNQAIFVSRDVIFYEDVFLFGDSQQHYQDNQKQSKNGGSGWIEDLDKWDSPREKLNDKPSLVCKGRNNEARGSPPIQGEPALG